MRLGIVASSYVVMIHDAFIYRLQELHKTFSNGCATNIRSQGRQLDKKQKESRNTIRDSNETSALCTLPSSLPHHLTLSRNSSGLVDKHSKGLRKDGSRTLCDAAHQAIAISTGSQR
jgi:hypothetical protein